MAAGEKLIHEGFVVAPKVLRRLYKVDPAAYNGKMAGEWDGTSSDNWDMVACEFELLNHLNGTPTDKPLRFILDTFVKGEVWESGQGLGQNEFSGEYTQHHIVPAYVIWCLTQHFAKQDPEWGGLDPIILNWLRAWISWLALGSNGQVGYELSLSERVPKGPRIVSANGGGKRFANPLPMTAACGERGVVFGDYFFFVTAKGQNDMLSFFALRSNEFEPKHGAKGANLNDLCSALKERGLYRDPVSPDERNIMRRVVAGDLDALDWAAELTRGFKAPGCLPWVRRYEDNSVVFGIRRASGSSTCPSYATLIRPDGTSDTLIADFGYRNSGGKGYVKAGTCVVDDEKKTATAQRNDKSLPAITLKLPQAKLVWSLDTQEDGKIVTWRHDKSSYPPPAIPPVTPLPEKEEDLNWFEKLVRFFQDLF